MTPKDSIAVIFVSRRSEQDEDGYAAAAAEMERLAHAQPGFLGMESVRGVDRRGITVAYFADEASALAWRNHPDHAAARAQGRALWYDSYDVVVTRVLRSYGSGA